MPSQLALPTEAKMDENHSSLIRVLTHIKNMADGMKGEKLRARLKENDEESNKKESEKRHREGMTRHEDLRAIEKAGATDTLAEKGYDIDKLTDNDLKGYSGFDFSPHSGVFKAGGPNYDDNGIPLTPQQKEEKASERRRKIRDVWEWKPQDT